VDTFATYDFNFRIRKTAQCGPRLIKLNFTPQHILLELYQHAALIDRQTRTCLEESGSRAGSETAVVMEMSDVCERAVGTGRRDETV